MKSLPDKLSDLIDVALEDLANVEADPRYEVDMGQWHEPYTEKCVVCLAGAVMAQSLDVPPNYSLNPDDFNEATCYKLLALNQARLGLYGGAALYLGQRLPYGIAEALPRPEPYWFNAAKFRADLSQAAAILRQNGY